MPFGDVLAQNTPVPLRTADGHTATVGGTWIQNWVLRVVGLPHLGWRIRARAMIPLMTAEAGAEVLDAGCGPGINSITLSQHGLRVTSIDADPEKLETLEVLKRFLAPSLKLERADVCRLPFEDSSFDKILCSEVLEHIEDDHGAVSEFARVLRPGGLLVITVPSDASIVQEYEDDFGHVRPGYNSESLQTLLRSKGLTVVSCSSYLHSAVGQWAWQVNHRIFRSKVLTVATFYPLFWVSVLLDRLLSSQRPGLGYLALARRDTASQS
jgi:ubiquinone/menaquinone biosynthesis C-methylase UbiE